ncbi:MAG: hypothetical protein ACUVWV_13300 [Thermodesulfobacteriota bacterium]
MNEKASAETEEVRSSPPGSRIGEREQIFISILKGWLTAAKF